MKIVPRIRKMNFSELCGGMITAHIAQILDFWSVVVWCKVQDDYLALIKTY